MITEHAVLQIDPTKAAEFEAAFAQARPLIAGQPGFLSLRLLRIHETAGRYVLFVGWAALADHTEGFRSSPEYAPWRALLHPFYDPMPDVEHASDVFTD